MIPQVFFKDGLFSKVLFGVLATNTISWVGLTSLALFFPPLADTSKDRSSVENESNILPMSDMPAPEFNVADALSFLQRGLPMMILVLNMMSVGCTALLLFLHAFKCSMFLALFLFFSQKI